MKETIKAKEIIESYKKEKVYEERNGTKYTLIITDEQARHYALIHVNGIIDALSVADVYEYSNNQIIFWLKVREEIEQTKI